MDGLMDGVTEPVHEIRAHEATSHIPIKYTFGEYTMCTFNIGDFKTKTVHSEKIGQIDASILFCQEVAKVDKLLPNHICLYSKQRATFYEGAILVKKASFEKVHHVVYDDLADAELEDATRGRLCTAIIDKKLIAISWHGRHRVPQELKRNDLKKLLRYARQLSNTYRLDVIIGGDFNMEADAAAGIVGERGTIKNANKWADGHIYKHDYDYFVLLEYREEDVREEVEDAREQQRANVRDDGEDVRDDGEDVKDDDKDVKDDVEDDKDDVEDEVEDLTQNIGERLVINN